MACYGMPWGFRGLIASASLKLCHQRRVRGRRGCFRGLIASASLKPQAFLVIGVPLARFPRLDCLGLIEALTIEYDGTVTLQFPRLDCLGLIEATPSVNAPKKALMSFRGLIASASLKRELFATGITFPDVSEA